MSKDQKKTIVLLDSHAILHRAYHALPDFSSSKGEATGALFGLSTMVLRIIEEFKPDFIFACFDLPKPTYRHEAYADYKAGRKKTDNELVKQIIKSREFFEAFSIPIFEKEGFEADDMLGTIVECLKDRDDVSVIIASGDMDTMQLIDKDKVKVFTLKKGIKDTVLYGEKEIVERFGFAPRQLTDYKGLRGDTSDNIKGIKGIGEKTAESLIKEFGTIEEMYEVLETGEKARFKKAGITDRVFELLKNGKEEALFSKMLATIRRDAPIQFALGDKTWKEEMDLKKVKAFFSELEFRSLLSRVDTVLGSRDALQKKELFEQTIDETLKRELCVAVWLLDSSKTNPTLDDVFHVAKTEDILLAKKNILEKLKQENLLFVFEEIELPLIAITSEMEKRGIQIDLKKLISLSKEYHESLEVIQKQIWELAGGSFNISSPKQLGEILFDKLELSVKGLKKTAGGARSTKESELEKLEGAHPIIGLILQFRELSKLLSTYIDNIPSLLDQQNRLHAKFVQTGTTTGRLSSEGPNLQNIPIKTALGRNIRHAFVASEGYTLIALDYSQIELRIAAFLSQDHKLIEIFKKGEDVHLAVASEVFNVPFEKVDKEMRRKAKVINFGILYGMGVNALKANLGSTREEAQKFYDDYFKTFSTLASYLEDTKEFARRHGYTLTYFKRRRYFEGINSKLPFIRSSFERMAINAPIQGTQADLSKLAMVRLNTLLHAKKFKDNAFLLLQIHDEVIFEVKDEMVSDFAKQAKEIMEAVLTVEETKGVPIVANVSVGKNWGEMTPLEV